MTTFTRWYLEYEGGGSSKFYEVIHFNGMISKRWGRIGAPKGQMQTARGTKFEAQEAATKKEAKGYEYQQRGTRYPLNNNTEAAMRDAIGKEDAALLTSTVDAAIRAALEETNKVSDPLDDLLEQPAQQQIDLLATRAANLVPLVAADPLKHAADIAEVREGAEEMRAKVRRLDAHLETLEVLLTSGMSA